MIIVRRGDSLEIDFELIDDESLQPFDVRGWQVGAYLLEDTGPGSSPLISLEVNYNISSGTVCVPDFVNHHSFCVSYDETIPLSSANFFINGDVVFKDVEIGKIFYVAIKLKQGYMLKTIFFSEIFVNKS